MDLTGRIGLIQGGQDFWAKAIVATTGSPFHHCIVATSNTQCMSAEIPKALLRPLSHFAGQITWLDVPATDEQRRTAAWHALALDGTPYNRISFGLAGAHAIHIPTPHALSTWAARYGMDCVMLTCAAYAAAGITLLEDPVTASPADMAKVGTLETPDADSATQTL
jgi:hypothetical protein